jgi:hypothetical protein
MPPFLMVDVRRDLPPKRSLVTAARWRFSSSIGAVVHQHQRYHSHLEAQQSLACHSIIGWDNGDMLTSGTDIPQASTETGALVNRGGTPCVEHQVHGLSSGVRRLRPRQPEQSPLRNVERPAAAYDSPSILKGFVEKSAAGPQ